MPALELSKDCTSFELRKILLECGERSIRGFTGVGD